MAMWAWPPVHYRSVSTKYSNNTTVVVFFPAYLVDHYFWYFPLYYDLYESGLGFVVGCSPGFGFVWFNFPP